MKTKVRSLTLFLGLITSNTWASQTPWVFTSAVSTKSEMLSIAPKESCRPLDAKLVTPKCSQYKLGYVCPQGKKQPLVISTYETKKDCTKALKKARRLLAKQ